MLVGAAGVAAQTLQDVEATRATAQALSPLAALVPLGVSPFLALGLFGAATDFTSFALPPSLDVLTLAPVWGTLLGLSVLLHVGRSFKLIKPLAEMAGTTESLVAFVVMAMLLLAPETAGTLDPAGMRDTVSGTGALLGAGGSLAASPLADVHQASILGGIVLGLAAVTGLVALILLRMAFDLLTWLSPIPFVDAGLQLVKLGVTALLVGVAIVLPTVAIGLNIALLVLMVLVARWVFRLSRFTATVLVDRLVGTFGPVTVEVGEGYVEPVGAWVVSSQTGLPRFALVPVRWTSGAGWMAGAAEDPSEATYLGPSGESTLSGGIMGTTLVTPRGTFFLTARYRRAGQHFAAATGTPLAPSRFGGGPTIEVRTI